MRKLPVSVNGKATPNHRHVTFYQNLWVKDALSVITAPTQNLLYVACPMPAHESRGLAIMEADERGQAFRNDGG